MLTSLTIKNYALIDDIHIGLGKGLLIITGETGAGKSILLGALSLLLGKRADLSILKDAGKKCIIEASFAIEGYDLAGFFETNGIDYDDLTILRRELLPGGKSRAFINDSPVTLHVLSLLAKKLIDIHSQHETLQLGEDDFQFNIIDAVAQNQPIVAQYKKTLNDYRQTFKKLQELQAAQQEAQKEHDYYSFLLKELRETPLEDGMQEHWEATLQTLTHAEEIREKIITSLQLLNEEPGGILAMLSQLRQLFQKLAAFGNSFYTLHQRINSIYIELDDVVAEIEQLQETAEANPLLLEEITQQLQHLYTLQKKHQVATIAQLLERRKELEEKTVFAENIDLSIAEQQEKLLHLKKELDSLAVALHKKRAESIENVKKYIETSLSGLGIKNGRLNIILTPTESYNAHGKDRLEFLFSANTGAAFGKLNKVASGGELSRIMLSVKSLLASHSQLPTLILDEIDAGVSGEIAHKMGEIMEAMGRTMQVITITHLPQIAAKGTSHFKVYKEETASYTHTHIKELTPEERVAEIAAMMSGKNISESAKEHARDLLSLRTN